MPLRESSPQPAIDISTKHHRRLIYLLAAVAVWYVVYLVLLREFTGDSFMYGEKPGLFWLQCHQETSLKVAVLSPIAIIALLLLIPGFLMGKYENQLAAAFILASLLLMILGLLGPMPNQLRHIQTVQHGNYNYYLAERTENTEIIRDVCLHPDFDHFPGHFAHEYLVYQCGRPGIMCHAIGCTAVNEPLYAPKGKLLVDAEGSIILEIKGLWVWTYPTDEQ